MTRSAFLAVIPLALLAAVGLFLYAGLNRDTDSGLPSRLIGKPAPRMDPAQLGQHEPPQNEDLATASFKLVNFWASWCAPCRVEHPNLMALADAGVPVYGVNYKDDEENAISFLDELGNPFLKVGTDSNGRLAIDWGVYGVPETFLIDQDGVVRIRVAGPLTNRILKEKILPVIDEAGGG